MSYPSNIEFLFCFSYCQLDAFCHRFNKVLMFVCLLVNISFVNLLLYFLNISQFLTVLSVVDEKMLMLMSAVILTNTESDEYKKWRPLSSAVSEYSAYSVADVQVYRGDQRISSTKNGVRTYSDFLKSIGALSSV